MVVVLVLTALTQLGGVLWLVSRWTRRPILAFVLLYIAAWTVVQSVAPLSGRVALPCFGETMRAQSPLYCVLMRNFVTPEVKAVAEVAAQRLAAEFPGTVTLTLDGGFPFVTGFPLLPHLSHDDGKKLDFALFYSDPEGNYAPRRTRAALGYFAFEALGAEETCPNVWLTLRWRFEWLQPWMRDLILEPGRTAALARALLADPRVGKMFIEPALAARLRIADPKLRFQGCRAARHDDHIHIQL